MKTLAIILCLILGFCLGRIYEREWEYAQLSPVENVLLTTPLP